MRLLFLNLRTGRQGRTEFHELTQAVFQDEPEELEENENNKGSMINVTRCPLPAVPYLTNNRILAAHSSQSKSPSVLLVRNVI